ncbi:hypothetical protein [Photobacterium lutimaris]|uniref:Uncharacterized protein n=1 Tax=Photobacterium lutimaris TaxID=388278 RepID=A0A2T3J4M6_9GAMM|nr:hypothetical protein [Photobacterium lutimaris]PSU36203.1 hypothetical protein C9I99_04170 [Photobacterium lutimaris]TDR74926.1 hypothetical protein DFP78_106257 [Photobacterium lutimaris]
MFYNDTLKLLDDAKWYVDNHLFVFFAGGPVYEPKDYSDCVLVDMVVFGDDDRIQLAIDLDNRKVYSTMFHCELDYSIIKKHFDSEFDLDKVIEYFKWFVKEGCSTQSWEEFDMRLLYEPIHQGFYELEIDQAIYVRYGLLEWYFSTNHGLIFNKQRMHKKVEVSGLDIISQKLQSTGLSG